jgi:hypothetical protein
MSLDMKRRTATPTSYTARASIEAVNALTFEVDPSVGADQKKLNSIAGLRSDKIKELYLATALRRYICQDRQSYQNVSRETLLSD